MQYSSWRTSDGLYTLKDSENKQIVLPYKYIKHTSVKNYKYGKYDGSSIWTYVYDRDNSKDFYMYRQRHMIGFTHFDSVSQCKAFADAHPDEYVYYDNTGDYGWIDPTDSRFPYEGNKVYFIPALVHKDLQTDRYISRMFSTADDRFELSGLFSKFVGIGAYPLIYNPTSFEAQGFGDTMLVVGDANYRAPILFGKRKSNASSGSIYYGLLDGDDYYCRDSNTPYIGPNSLKKVAYYDYSTFPYIMLARCGHDSSSNDYYMDYLVRYTKDTGVFIGYSIQTDGVLRPWISIVDFYISDGKYRSKFQLINCNWFSGQTLTSTATFVRDCETDTIYQCDILGKINTLYPNWMDSTTKAGDYFNGADCITWNFSGSFDIRKVSSSDPAELIGLFNQRFSSPTLTIKPVNGNIKCMMFKSDLSTNLKACTITNATPLGQSEVTDHFITITERSTTHPRIIYKVKD